MAFSKGSERMIHFTHVFQISGDCLYDSLTTTSPGSTAPPVICGYNTGQHM